MKPLTPHSFVTLPPDNPGYITPQPEPPRFTLCPCVAFEKHFESNVSPAIGTPLDSARFRQAVNIRKK
jgi:hypothetical protein